MLSYQLDKNLYSYWQKDTRFYVIELYQDLWGNWLLKKTWGSAVNSAWATAGFPRHVEPRKKEIREDQFRLFAAIIHQELSFMAKQNNIAYREDTSKSRLNYAPDSRLSY